MGKLDFVKKMYQSYIWDRGPEWVGVFSTFTMIITTQIIQKKTFLFKDMYSLGHTFIICNTFVTYCAFK